MAHKSAAVALGVVVAILSLSPAVAQPMSAAPAAGPDARYCLHVGPITGSQVETVQCWTRQQWADQDVDVDREWSTEGVAVLG